jgi:glycosyltransferase involved in cell wall biosynthesis
MNRKIRILHIIDSLSVGGAEQLLVGLANRIDAQAFDTYICCLGVIDGNVLESDLVGLSAPPYVVNSRRLYNPRLITEVARYITTHNIDIVHTQLTHADIVGRIAGRLAKRPVISTLQNEPQDYERQRFDRRWLVGVSQRICDLFVQDWHIPAERVCTIYNAVPMEQYLSIPETSALGAADGPVITNIGRLTEQKAQHIFLAAARLVLDQRPDARFMIVGRGHLEQPLREQAQSLGIAERVAFTGVRRDIPNVLAESDVFVLSSFWEGLPLTAVEAMAAARPVVLTDVGGNRELVDSGTNGLIVPPDDVPALAQALLELLNDESRRLGMGLAARKRVQHDFSIDTIVDQYESLYRSLIGQRAVVTANA